MELKGRPFQDIFATMNEPSDRTWLAPLVLSQLSRRSLVVESLTPRILFVGKSSRSTRCDGFFKMTRDQV